MITHKIELRRRRRKCTHRHEHSVRVDLVALQFVVAQEREGGVASQANEGCKRRRQRDARREQVAVIVVV